MLTKTHFYHETLKKTVAVFGTLFNNITIAKKIITPASGATLASTIVSDIERVPIAYGPKSKFLARIKEQPDLSEAKIAIKVPRMSFEITSIAYDASIKLNRLNKSLKPVAGSATLYSSQTQSTPYKIGMQLSIFGRNQDDVLQILEQILPSFNPEYTVTVLDMEAPGISADVPIILDSVGMSDEYEGDLSTTRRVIIYTLDFTVRIRFTGPVATQGVIQITEANMIINSNLDTNANINDLTLDPIETIKTTAVVNTQTAAQPYTVTVTMTDAFGFTSTVHL